MLARRGFLQGALAGALLAPTTRAWAEQKDALRLMRAPKLALVLGNGRYLHVPTLTNPVNDATAMGAALGAAGFSVTLRRDATRAEMLAAIQAHCQALAAKQAVGLFYFAGHGMQLAWRNYLLPVDATIGAIGDISAQGVDVGVLIDGITKAANPMNVVVLDACRDNPFGKDVRGEQKGLSQEQKGLSQMDAPQATLLAYATSPGHVASDGAGANGVYTEHLVKELGVRETKIEDVFKRVRLGVRRRTNGAQIPWESTSLEEDFYFLPPAQLTELSEPEREREFQEQRALWDKVKHATTPAPLIEYLSRYPSGDYSELAQLHLDRALARQGEQPIQVVSAEGNPFTKGTARVDTRYRVGDSYTYQAYDRAPKVAQSRFTTTITEITDSQVIFDRGLVTDLLGNTVRRPDGRTFTDNQNTPLEFEVGRQWVTRYRVHIAQGSSVWAEVAYRILAREPITVPAGTFNAFYIEGIGTNTSPRGLMEVQFLTWWDPQRVRRPIAREEIRRLFRDGDQAAAGRMPRRPRRRDGRGGEGRGGGRVLMSERHELVSFRQS